MSVDKWKLESPEVKSLQVLRGGLDTLQVNLGYRCNQACAHCHVNAGPNRTEEMTYKTIDLILKILKKERKDFLMKLKMS